MRRVKRENGEKLEKCNADVEIQRQMRGRQEEIKGGMKRAVTLMI